MIFETSYRKPHEPIEKKTPESLSPEAHKMVMDKVEYINSKGTAFSWLHGDMNKVLPSILKNGMLGKMYTEHSLTEETEDIKKQWVEDFRKNRIAKVHFNIIGRMHGDPDVDAVLWARRREPVSICVLFNVHPSEEFPPPSNYHIYGAASGSPEELAQERDHEYRRAVADYEEAQSTQKASSTLPGRPSKPNKFHPGPNDAGGGYDMGAPYVEDEYGFVWQGRIAPRKFRGLVVKIEEGNWVYEKEYDTWKFSDAMSNTLPTPPIDEVVNFMAATMIETNKAHPERIVPIYDREGNLLWPEKMTVEEIKKRTK